MNPIKKRSKAIIDQSNCVACGCCEKICPLQAIVVVGGIMAKVNPENAWAAENARKNARPALSIFRRLKREKTLV